MLNSHIWPITAAITEQGRLAVGGCELAALAREHGTPLYVLDEATIRASCRAYRAALAGGYAGETAIHYAGKALLNTAVARIVAEEGLGLDVVSGGELFVALRAGVPAGRIHMHGNAKPRAELEQALAAGIGQIVVDNLDELALLARLTAPLATPQPVALRIEPGVAPDTHHHIQTGQAGSKFGMPPGALGAAAELIGAAPGLRLVGLHAHLGSQIFDARPYAAALAVLLDCAARLRDAHGALVEEINIGGGLGAPYVEGQEAPDLGRFAALVGRALAEGCAARGLPRLRLGVEPGRSIVARAGVALYTIVSTKPLPAAGDQPRIEHQAPHETNAGGQPPVARYLHIDGGMGDNIRPALYEARYTALLANRAAEPPAEVVHIAGRYCETGDVLLRDVALPRAAPGDLIAVAAAGAYTLSMASAYNLVPRPAVLLAGDGRARLIQRRETFEDLVARDVL